MKLIRIIIYILAFLTASVLLILFISSLINNNLDQSKTVITTTATPNSTSSTTSQVVTTTNPDQSATQQPASENPPISASSIATSDPTTPATTTITPAAAVSTIKLSDNSNAYLNTLGVVKAKSMVSLVSQASGSVKKVNFQEGDQVKQGDLIVQLTGANLTAHPTEQQLKIAQITYDNAKAALNNLIKVNSESLKSAQLQVQIALSQASAIPYDLQVIQQNQTGLQDSLNILQDNLNNTLQKNNRDALKSRSDIDNMLNILTQAQNDQASTIRQINDIQQQINNTPVDPNPAVVNTSTTPSSTALSPLAQLQQKLVKLQAALAAQQKGINDLYTDLDKAKYAYSTATNTSQLSDNQVLSQIQQNQNQQQVLDLNLQSSKTKLGYTGNSSDALQLAQQGYKATQAQLSSAIDQAQNQLKLSKLNLDLAQDQTAGLQIKAPFSGILTSLNLTQGQSINAQAVIAELIDPKQFQLEVGVDADTADKINRSELAQIFLGGKWMDVSIKAISPKVDATTKQVKVTLQLPNIFFKINQNLQAKLPLTTAQNQQTKALTLPLDAVTIGTESQFVYINDHGKAKHVDVKTGQINGDQIEILEGLNPTDEVILEGAKSLIDGQVLQIK